MPSLLLVSAKGLPVVVVVVERCCLLVMDDDDDDDCLFINVYFLFIWFLSMDVVVLYDV